MTEQSNAELIAEANAVSTNDAVANPRRYRNLIGRLAERLGAADQRAAEYAAVMEQAEDYVTRHYFDTQMGTNVLTMLAGEAPTDVLREHDAALIEGLADDLDSALYEDIPHGSSIRFHYEAWLREKARQRREEQS